MKNLFGEEQSVETPRKPINPNNWFRGTKNGNPCIKMFGRGPNDATCKTCKFLTRISYDKVYIKCEVRGTSGGATSDHLAKWPVCGRYEEQDTNPSRTTKTNAQNDSYSKLP